MEKSKVYYTTFKTTGQENLLQKLRRLMITAGMKEIDFTGKYAAIKIHFGEYGNLAFLRPNYAKVMADLVKECGGKPFLTDCNTLYVGSRKNALDHIETAYLNGFHPYATGCHVLIGDGLKGTDETLVPINGEYVKEAKIGAAVMDADILLSLMHNDGKPVVADPDGCIGCGSCQRICAHEAPIIENGKARIDHDRCVGCGRCLAVCPKDVIQPSSGSSVKSLNCKMAEYSLSVCKGRPHFHVSLICDVSPNCDCHPENDIPIIPDVGMFASFDPVALDVACADAVNRMPVIDGSVLSDNLNEDAHHGEGHDHFHMTHPDTEWKSCIEHAVKIGLGNDEYELVTI